MDFGLVKIEGHYRRLLEANQIVAITEADWDDPEAADADTHFILGLPKDSVEQAHSRDTIRGKAVPSMVAVTKTTDVPDELRITKYPRFFGLIEQQHEVGDIDGMSGGPVFAVRSGDMKTWIVTMQSGWTTTRRYTFGCPVSTFMGIVKKDALRPLNKSCPAVFRFTG